MNTSQPDRLLEIEARVEASIAYGDMLATGDLEWLVAEVKRLRKLYGYDPACVKCAEGIEHGAHE